MRKGQKRHGEIRNQSAAADTNTATWEHALNSTAQAMPIKPNPGSSKVADAASTTIAATCATIPEYGRPAPRSP